jgi:hypothetical protein
MRFVLHRREMVLATAAAFFPLHGASGETGSRNTQPAAGINADPTVPIPAPASLGIGKDRALVLGGGGEYFIAWLLGFAHGLSGMGVSYNLADLIVGRSDRRQRGRGRSSRAVARRYRSFWTVSKTTGGFDTDERVQPQSGARA